MSFLWLVEGESDDYESVKVAMDSKIDGWGIGFFSRSQSVRGWKASSIFQIFLLNAQTTLLVNSMYSLFVTHFTATSTKKNEKEKTPLDAEQLTEDHHTS